MFDGHKCIQNILVGTVTPSNQHDQMENENYVVKQTFRNRHINICLYITDATKVSNKISTHNLDFKRTVK